MFITPINILFIGGGEFWSLVKIKLMLLPQSTYCSQGWRILIPEDKVDVIAPTSILFIGGGEFWSLVKIKLILLHITPINILFVGGGEFWSLMKIKLMLTDVIAPTTILFIGGGEVWSLTEIKLMLLPQPTYCSEGLANFNVMVMMMTVSVEQRPGWGEHL